jgi:GNAT superfamily N-acetyltransferase
MRIRPPATGDEIALARLAGELGYPSSAHQIRARLELLLRNAAHFVAVAEASGALLGWVHAEHRVNLESGERAELVGLVVSASARRSGVGSALVAAAEAWAAARGLASIVVRSNVVRPESHAFYRRIGYEPTKAQQVYARTLRGMQAASQNRPAST